MLIVHSENEGQSLGVHISITMFVLLIEIFTKLFICIKRIYFKKNSEDASVV